MAVGSVRKQSSDVCLIPVCDTSWFAPDLSLFRLAEHEVGRAVKQEKLWW